ncbi:MAG: OmpA family protein [Spirochaetales bacterium]|nr:OmpA family protein [Spirochaetales bacterium]
MKKMLLTFAVLALALAACKSLDENSVNLAQLSEQERLVGELRGDIQRLEDQIKQLEAENTSDTDQINSLSAEKVFLEDQIGRLSGDYQNLAELVAAEKRMMDQAVLEIETNLADEIAAGDIEILSYNGMLIIHIRNSILFKPSQADILVENEEILSKIAASFKFFPDRIIRVEGHTATGKNTVRYPSAWELGAARAVNVTRFFQEKSGIAPEQLVAVSFGEWRPVSSNETEEGKARNRRIEIVILNRPLYQWQELRKTE